MFHETTKSLVKQLDPKGDFIPVYSLLDQNHFRPLSVVQRKRKQPWWQNVRYHKTGYKICDVLLPGDHTALLDISDSDPFTIVDDVDGKLEGVVSAATDLASLEITGSATVSHARSVKVKKRHINSQVLDSLNRDRKINMDHQLIKQSEKFKKDLYVITETVDTVEKAEFKESNQAESSILADLRIRIKLRGRRNSKKAIILPKDCTLAFRVKRLLIREGSLSISLFPDDKTTTFISGVAGRLDDDAVKMKRVPQLREIEQECTPLLLLSTELRGMFFNVFLAIIRNTDLLEELEIQLEQALDGIEPIKLKTCRPELQNLVENLLDSTGAICPDISASVLYLLQALDELSESELLLLEESVERKIIPKQVELVQHILENKFSNQEKQFPVDIKKVSPFTQDELNITEAIIKLSGVAVKRSGSSFVVGGNIDAFLALGTLYVALYVLNGLSK